MASGRIIKTKNGTKVAIANWEYSDSHALVDVIGRDGSYQTTVAKTSLVNEDGEPLDEKGN